MPDFQLLIDLFLCVGVWGQEWNPWPHAYTASIHYQLSCLLSLLVIFFKPITPEGLQEHFVDFGTELILEMPKYHSRSLECVSLDYRQG